MSTWYVYLLRCSDNSLYCGVTTDPERRLKEHNSGTGAKYTRCRLPVVFETYESFPDKRSAYRAEYAVKQKRAAHKADFLKLLASQAEAAEHSQN
ncbi:GIY-YIG nuclease family protein [Maridesulfovibrio sp.]|uniref:GIY-YIG nuclease family protein n=1 Tax=Maridesulfovibrio sp. TaxID=2795000 RepID=UPI0039EFD21A